MAQPIEVDYTGDWELVEVRVVQQPSSECPAKDLDAAQPEVRHMCGSAAATAGELARPQQQSMMGHKQQPCTPKLSGSSGASSSSDAGSSCGSSSCGDCCGEDSARPMGSYAAAAATAGSAAVAANSSVQEAPAHAVVVVVQPDGCVGLGDEAGGER